MRSNFPKATCRCIARDDLADFTDSSDPMNRKRQSAGMAPMNCMISGASMGKGRFSTKKATLDSLYEDVGYDALRDGTGMAGRALCIV